MKPTMSKLLPLSLTLAGLICLAVFRSTGSPIIAETGNVLIAAGVIGWIMTRLQSMRRPKP